MSADSRARGYLCSWLDLLVRVSVPVVDHMK